MNLFHALGAASCFSFILVEETLLSGPRKHISLKLGVDGGSGSWCLLLCVFFQSVFGSKRPKIGRQPDLVVSSLSVPSNSHTVFRSLIIASRGRLVPTHPED